MITEVVNIRRDRLFGMHRDDVYIGRAGQGLDGYFGNPIRTGRECPECGDTHERPGETLSCYQRYLRRRVGSDPEFRRRVARLRGKRLGCFCKPKPCHGDLLAVWAEALPPRVVTVDFRKAKHPSTQHEFYPLKTAPDTCHCGDREGSLVHSARVGAFADALGIDLSKGRWVDLGGGARGFVPRRVVRVDFRLSLLSEPCRCERGRHTQCRACFNGFRSRCECAPCLASRGGREAWDWDEDDPPSEAEILGEVGDR